MAGELAAIDANGNADLVSMPSTDISSDFASAVGTMLGSVIAAPMQLIVTKSGQVLGFVNVPDGWDISKDGFPRGYSVGWDAGSGVSTIYDRNNNPVGRMVAPQSVSIIATLPVEEWICNWPIYDGQYVARPRDDQLAAIKSLTVNGAGPLYLVSDPGTNYGGPDGGASR